MSLDPLLIDIYPKDHPVNWDAYIGAGYPFCGAIFKLTQGLDYEYSAWANKQRDHLLASERYGVDLFDGFYHYLTFHQPGEVQAERFWTYLEKIGGERSGTLPAMADVERGGQRVANPTKNQVTGITRKFCDRYTKLSGRSPTIYGGELLRALGCKREEMGGCRSAVALYASELHGKGESTAQFLARTGTDLEHAMLWQYVSAEGAPTGPAGYPREAPGIGRVDINAVILPGGLDALRALAGPPDSA
jgi:hypothetical protein